MTAITNDYVNTDGGIKSKNSVVKFSRPADVTAYGVGDVISDAATGAALKFLGVGRSGRIDHAHVCMDEADTADLELWIFDAEPTNFADNAALALVEADMAKLIAVFSLANSAKKSAGGFQVYMATLDTEGANIKRYCTADGTLWGLLVTRSAFTPDAGGVYTVNLQVESDVF
jgi:hypothetical protein